MSSSHFLKAAPARRIADVTSNITRQPVLAIPVFLVVGIADAQVRGLAWAAGCLLATMALPLLYLLYLKRSNRVRDTRNILRDERNGPLWVVTALWMVAFAMLASAGIPAGLRATLLAYVLVTPAFAILTRYTKPSLHAAGATWTVVCLVNTFGPWALSISLLVPLVWWARITLGRHTLLELVLGTLIGGLLTQLAFYLGS